MPGIEAGKVGVSDIAGTPTDPETIVLPYVTVLPVGWSWALHLCQSVLEYAITCSGFTPKQFIGDKRDAVVMNDKGSTAVAAYVDNFGVLGADRQVVDEGLQKIIATLRGWGLLVHEIEPASQRADFVGRGTVSIKKTRINRIKFAIDELLERQVCSGRTMQLLVGHLTWALLCRRCGLSLINACYAFIGDGSNQNRRLWKSVRQELQWVSAILPLLKFHVNSSWSPDITSSEASPWGYGVCYRTVDSHVAESIGRSSERWRFLFADATNAREHAFSPKHLHDSDHLGDEQPGINSEHLHGSHQPSEEHPGIYSQLGDDSGVHYRFISDGVFTEIPVDILNPDDWSIAWSRPWRFEANILNTEARALVWSAEHLLHCSRAFGRRLVCLTDNLPSALGVTKGRAKSTHLLRPLRKLCALSLATKSKVHVRWLPSERNVADVPSRATDIWEAQGLRGWWNSPVRHVEDGSKGCEPSVAEAGRSSCLATPAAASEDKAQRIHSRGPDLPRGPKCPGTYTPGLHATDQGLQPLVGPPCGRLHKPPGRRQHSGGVPAGPVRLRFQSGLRDSDSCCHQVLSSTVGEERKWKSAPVFTGPPGLEECRSTITEDATANRGIWSHTGVLHSDKLLGDGGSPVCSVDDLHETWRGKQPHNQPAYPPYEQIFEQHAVFCRAAPSSRGTGTWEDGSFRPGNSTGQRLVDQSHPHETYSHEEAKHTTVEPHTHGNSQCVSEGCQVPSVGTTGSKHVHPSPRRCILRHHQPTEDHGRGQAAGKMVSRFVSPPLCKDSTNSKRTSQNSPKCHRIRSDGTQQPARTFERKQQDNKATIWNEHVINRMIKTAHVRNHGPKKCDGAQLLKHIFRRVCKDFGKRRVYLDLFCGDHGIDRQLRRRGEAVIALDISDDPRIDLTSPKVAAVVFGWIRSGCIKGVWLATPCTSWSRARHGPSHSSWGPLRTNQHLFGIPGLSAKDLHKTKVGNQTMFFTHKIIRLCISLSVPCFLENPVGSMIWLTPQLTRVCAHHSSRQFITDFCQHGARWRKRTRIQGWLSQDDSRLHLTCHGRNGVCCRTGKHHITLKGQDPISGQLWTHLAQPYPARFCVVAADVLSRSGDAIEDLSYKRLFGF